MAGAEALPMMHHHGGELVEEVFWGCGGGAPGGGAGAGQAAGGGVPVAVGLHVQQLVEAHVHADLLPVVPPRPPEGPITSSRDFFYIFINPRSLPKKLSYLK